MLQTLKIRWIGGVSRSPFFKRYEAVQNLHVSSCVQFQIVGRGHDESVYGKGELPSVETRNQVAVVSCAHRVVDSAGHLVFDAREGEGVEKSLGQKTTDVRCVSERKVIFFYELPVLEKFPHHVVTVSFGSVHLDGIDVSAVPDQITFLNPPDFSLGIEQDRFYPCLSAECSRHTSTELSCCRVKKYGFFLRVLKDCLQCRRKIGCSEILECAGRSVVELQKKKILVQLFYLGLEGECPCRDGLTNQRTELTVDES